MPYCIFVVVLVVSRASSTAQAFCMPDRFRAQLNRYSQVLTCAVCVVAIVCRMTGMLERLALLCAFGLLEGLCLPCVGRPGHQFMWPPLCSFRL